jgi:transposase-like protein
MLTALPDDGACRLYLESVRWTSGTPTCPHCGTVDDKAMQLKIKGVFRGMYKCRSCRERFTVTVGTMFEGSHIPLRKWFIAIYIFSSHKKGISSHQLASDLGVTQKTAWFMLGRIRNAFKLKTDTTMSGTVQADETYVGGKNKIRHKDKKVENSQGRSVKNKTPVFGVVEADGMVHTTVVCDTKASTLKPLIEKMVEDGSIVVTDEWSAYYGLSNNYDHKVINHKANEYCKDGFHTNGIENFWSLLKRGIYGIYHQVSAKHLHRYCDEFSYRYNSRKITTGERFTFSLVNATTSKLTYKELIGRV